MAVLMRRLSRRSDNFSASSVSIASSGVTSLRSSWRKMMRLAERWLPSPKLRHPYPDWRFDVMTRGGSPVR
jgi:hypothetical protein